MQCNVGFKMFVNCHAFNLPLFMHSKPSNHQYSAVCIMQHFHDISLKVHDILANNYEVSKSSRSLGRGSITHLCNCLLVSRQQQAVVPAEVHWTSIMTFNRYVFHHKQVKAHKLKIRSLWSNLVSSARIIKELYEISLILSSWVTPICNWTYNPFVRRPEPWPLRFHCIKVRSTNYI